MKLSVPLTETQVVAAGKIHNELEQWKAADRVLKYLGTTIPENTDLDRVLLKVAALNQLYGTNVYYLYAMAQHIVEVFSSERTWDECSLVEQIAYLEASGRRHQSFASKYCHFFVDSEQFPLFDSYVPVVVRMHLGRGNYRCKTTDQTYRNFYEDLQTLRRSISFDPTIRELDHYLWLRGQWETLRKKGERAPIGAEVKDLFKRRDSDLRVRTLIDQLCGL